MSFRTPYRLVPLPSLETYLRLKDTLTFLLGPSKSHSTFPLWCGLAFSLEDIFYLLAPRASQTKLIIETEKLNLLCFQDVTKSAYSYLFNSSTRLFNCHCPMRPLKLRTAPLSDFLLQNFLPIFKNSFF